MQYASGRAIERGLTESMPTIYYANALHMVIEFLRQEDQLGSK
jgi:hypothetical protein